MSDELKRKQEMVGRHLLDATPERLRAEARYEEVEQAISTLNILLNSLQRVDDELDDAMVLRQVRADFAPDVKEHFDRLMTRVVGERNDLFLERERALDTLLLVYRDAGLVNDEELRSLGVLP